MLVKQIANQVGVTAGTIRHYTRIGILQPYKSVNGYHHFAIRDQRTMKFCIQAKALGFSLVEIRKLIDMAEHGKSPDSTARRFLSQNIKTLSHEVEEVGKRLHRMERAEAAWREMSDSPPKVHEVCSLVECL